MTLSTAKAPSTTSPEAKPRRGRGSSKLHAAGRDRQRSNKAGTKAANRRSKRAEGDETAKDIIWEQMFAELEEIKEKTGTCSLPDKKGRLAKWVYAQRKAFRRLQYSRGTATTRARLERLESLGFEFSSSSYVSWDVMFAKYKSRDSIPLSADEIRKLKLWMSNQRLEYSRLRRGLPNNITDDRIAKLESVGFQWVGRTGKPVTCASSNTKATKNEDGSFSYEHYESDDEEEEEETKENSKKRKRADKKRRELCDSKKRSPGPKAHKELAALGATKQPGVISTDKVASSVSSLRDDGLDEEADSALQALTSMKRGVLIAGNRNGDGNSAPPIVATKSLASNKHDANEKRPTENDDDAATSDYDGNSKQYSDNSQSSSEELLSCTSVSSNSGSSSILSGKPSTMQKKRGKAESPSSAAKNQAKIAAASVATNPFGVVTQRTGETATSAASRDSRASPKIYRNVGAEQFFADHRFFNEALAAELNRDHRAEQLAAANPDTTSSNADIAACDWASATRLANSGFDLVASTPSNTLQNPYGALTSSSHASALIQLSANTAAVDNHSGAGLFVPLYMTAASQQFQQPQLFSAGPPPADLWLSMLPLLAVAGGGCGGGVQVPHLMISAAPTCSMLSHFPLLAGVPPPPGVGGGFSGVLPSSSSSSSSDAHFLQFRR